MFPSPRLMVPRPKESLMSGSGRSGTGYGNELYPEYCLLDLCLSVMSWIRLEKVNRVIEP